MAYFEVNKKPRLTFPTLTGSIVTFNSQYAGLPLKSHTVEVVATQSGSGTPSPSNPRPISGWDAIHIGNISDNTNISYFQGVLNGTYGFVDLGSLSWGIATYSSNRLFYASLPRRSIRLTANVLCFKYVTTQKYWAQAPNKSIGVIVDDDYTVGIIDDSYTDAPTFKTAMSGVYLIYKLATPTTPSFTNAQFEALCESFGMNGQSTTVQIGSTVYGGEYDARTGVFRATHKGILARDVSGWAKSGSVFYRNLPDVWTAITPDTPTGRKPLMCSHFDYSSSSIVSDLKVGYGGANNNGNIVIRYDALSTISDFNDYIANNDVFIVYPLATPTTIQLLPCPIETLLGENNIWADTGDTTLQYPKFG